jgi:hypothetical protein
MKALKYSHIAVVHDDLSEHGGARIAARLQRMAIGRVTTVARIEEAKRLCRAGGLDVCLVVLGGTVPDAVPEALSDAPGQSVGVPTLIVAPVVTPHLRKTARLCGYVAVLPGRIAPRMLYRRIGAVLQGRRPHRSPVSGRLVMTAPARLANLSKPTVH